jgi:hypothetical protein
MTHASIPSRTPIESACASGHTSDAHHRAVATTGQVPRLASAAAGTRRSDYAYVRSAAGESIGPVTVRGRFLRSGVQSDCGRAYDVDGLRRPQVEVTGLPGQRVGCLSLTTTTRESTVQLKTEARSLPVCAHSINDTHAGEAEHGRA